MSILSLYLPESSGHDHGLVGEEEDAPLELEEPRQVIEDGEDEGAGEQVLLEAEVAERFDDGEIAL